MKRTTSAKAALRKSAKRVDKALKNSDDEFLSIEVSKEGTFQLWLGPKQNKWKLHHFTLSGNTLYWKKQETSTSIVGEFLLKNSTIEKLTTGVPKNSFGLKISRDDKNVLLSLEKESLQEEWFKELLESVDKPQGIVPLNKKGTRIIRVQKRVGGSIATSSAGKKIIKEALGNEGYKGLRVIKDVVTAVDGKKKATEVEESLILLGVKIILLAKNKILTMHDLKQHRDNLKSVCDVMAHCTLFPFEYNPQNLRDLTSPLSINTSKTLSRCLSQRNITRFLDLHMYLTSTPILDMLFTDPTMKEARKDWQYLMKNTSSRLDYLE